MMRIIITDSYRQMGREAANMVAGQLYLKPDSVLGLATGSTPLPMYRRLIALHRSLGLDFSEVPTFTLDEYVGMAPANPQSYHYFLAEDLEAEGHRYDALIQQKGGIDLQVLGIGQNAHIGFNEPDVKFEAITHRVELDEETIRANSRFFQRLEDVPRYAISMGIKTIMMARRILLLANGANKADAMRKAVCGSVMPEAPASILQLHRDVTVILDRAAAARLPAHIEGTKILYKGRMDHAE